MPVQIHCPHCGQAFGLSDEQAPQYSGQTITCSRCGRPFTVPTLGASPAQPPALPPGGAPLPQVFGAPPTYSPPPSATGIDPRYNVPPAAPPPAVHGNGLAVGSFVAALIGFCVPVVPSLIAIVLGFMGLRRASRHPQAGGRGWAIAGLLIALLGLIGSGVFFAYFTLPELHKQRAQSRQLECAQRMRAMGNALLAYAQQNGGQFPPTLDPLTSINSFRSDDLYCPIAQSAGLKNTNYVYAGAGLTTAAPPECVLLYEPLDFHDYKGVNVLFVDGRVQFIGEIEAGKAVPKLRKGKNPPWTGSEPYTPPPPPRPATSAPVDTDEPTTTRAAGPADNGATEPVRTD